MKLDFRQPLSLSGRGSEDMWPQSHIDTSTLDEAPYFFHTADTVQAIFDRLEEVRRFIKAEEVQRAFATLPPTDVELWLGLLSTLLSHSTQSLDDSSTKEVVRDLLFEMHALLKNNSRQGKLSSKVLKRALEVVTSLKTLSHDQQILGPIQEITKILGRQIQDAVDRELQMLGQEMDDLMTRHRRI
jgi:hypothetical protein